MLLTGTIIVKNLKKYLDAMIAQEQWFIFVEQYLMKFKKVRQLSLEGVPLVNAFKAELDTCLRWTSHKDGYSLR